MCHVQPDLDILFLKLTAQIEDRLHQRNTRCTLCFGKWGFHAKPNFFCIIIVLPINQTREEGYILQCRCCRVVGKVAESVQPGGENVRTALRFSLWD